MNWDAWIWRQQDLDCLCEVKSFCLDSVFDFSERCSVSVSDTAFTITLQKKFAESCLNTTTAKHEDPQYTPLTTKQNLNPLEINWIIGKCKKNSGFALSKSKYLERSLTFVVSKSICRFPNNICLIFYIILYISKVIDTVSLPKSTLVREAFK